MNNVLWKMGQGGNDETQMTPAMSESVAEA